MRLSLALTPLSSLGTSQESSPAFPHPAIALQYRRLAEMEETHEVSVLWGITPGDDPGEPPEVREIGWALIPKKRFV